MPEATSSSTTADTPESPSLWQMVRETVDAWVDDDASSMGAALSYYTVFSMAPLLLIVIAVAGALFGQEAVSGELFGQLSGLMGPEAAAAIEAVLASSRRPTDGLVATLIGVGVLLIGATTVFGALQSALDRIWRVPALVKRSGVWDWLVKRMMSIGMIMGLAFLLMVSLVLGAVISALGKWWAGAFAGWETVAQLVNLGVGFVLTTAVFALIYKLMPRRMIAWGDVWLGAVVTAMLFTVGKFLIGLYIGRSGVTSGYGAAGSFIVIFVWVYYSAQIFLLGAEFTSVYARRCGSLKPVTAAQQEAAAAVWRTALQRDDTRG